MISIKAFSAALGFAFVAAWVGLGFGEAVLCLLGAGLFYALASYFEGDLDPAEMQARLGLTPRGAAAPAPQPRPATAPPPPRPSPGAPPRVR
jgi:hypothetical protein